MFLNGYGNFVSKVFCFGEIQGKFVGMQFCSETWELSYITGIVFTRSTTLLWCAMVNGFMDCYIMKLHSAVVMKKSCSIFHIYCMLMMSD